MMQRILPSKLGMSVLYPLDHIVETNGDWGIFPDVARKFKAYVPMEHFIAGIYV